VPRNTASAVSPFPRREANRGVIRVLTLVVLPALVLCASGCAEELGPERMVTTRVTGVVREGLNPVQKGFIEFSPTGGTVGNLASAPIRPDGTFVADAVAVGKNRVGIVAAPLGLPNAQSLFETLRTPIERDIPADRHDPITINLLDELVLYQRQVDAANR
jgi:hypothetical protein